jgi:hypothetical protein
MKEAVFPLAMFLAYFPEFDDESKYTKASVQSAGLRAMMHITPSAEGMPFVGKYREYGLFLMTAHIATLAKMDDGESGGVAGRPFKSTVGSVSVESTKPNSFVADDWNFWLSLTNYGAELLALLDTQAQGIFLNTPNDTVRDLL